MADEKDIRSEELTDEEASGVSGGVVKGPFAGLGGGVMCSNPNCGKLFHYTGASIYCDDCRPLFGN